MRSKGQGTLLESRAEDEAAAARCILDGKAEAWATPAVCQAWGPEPKLGQQQSRT